MVVKRTSVSDLLGHMHHIIHGKERGMAGHSSQSHQGALPGTKISAGQDNHDFQKAFHHFMKNTVMKNNKTKLAEMTGYRINFNIISCP